MCDEIDIEEHDVMDNPIIKRIFPDLSVIKKEINQYYDEVLNASSEAETEPLEELCQEEASLEDFCQEEAPLEDLCQEEAPLQDQCQEDVVTRESEVQLPKHIPNCIELGTNNAVHASEDSETQKASRYLHENIIILGSKPTLQCQENNYNSLRKEPKIILKNVNSFLNSCKRYCKECLILFPKPNLFNLHLINRHIKKRNEIGRRVGDKLFKCNACDRLLSSKNSLLRHFQNIHKDVKTLKKKVDRVHNKKVANEASQGKEITELSCFHCQQLFPTQSSLIEHLYEVLEPNKIGPNDRTKSSTNAKKPNKELNHNSQLKGECDEYLNESNPNHKNNHVANRHPHRHIKVDKDDSDSESILPQKNNQRRRLDNAVDLAECGDENIPKKKPKTNFNPFQNGVAKASERLKTKECNECKEQFISKKELKYHLRSIHTERSNNKNEIKRKTGQEKINFHKSKKLTHSKFYKCFICSKYNVTFEFYSRHIINDHNIKEVTEVKQVPFDSQCKFCPSKTSGFKSYNVHLLRFHRKQVTETYLPRKEQPVNKHHNKIDKKVLFASKSVLFKCMKCDLFFLSSNAAMDHSNHLSISDTCKCPVCQRKFRSENMALHEKQHSFSESFTTYTLPESGFSEVLYKCSNCTVHYSEENFLRHYLKCDSETPNSLYCKVCDILINRDDMECHETNHKEKQIHGRDFVIVESDMIDDREMSTKTDKTKKDESDMIHDRHLRTNTAKMKNNEADMIHDLDIRTNKAETKNNKSDMTHDRYISTNTPKTISNKSVKLRARHKIPNTARTKNGIVKKIRFGIESFDDCSKFSMSFCHTCKCFIGNVNLRRLHVEGKCGHMLKLVCKDCGLMLTTKTHATHKEYHKKEQISLQDYTFYDLKTEKRICPPIPDYPKCNSCGVHFLRNCDIRIHSCQEQDFITCNVCSIKLTEHAYKLHIRFHSYVIPSVNTKLKGTALQANPANEGSYLKPNSSVSDDAYIINVMTFYTCKSCQLTVNTYDKVVQHCQDHYDSQVVQLNMQKCQICTLTLHTSDYVYHRILHLNGKYNKDSIKIVDFDPFYFRYSNDFWTKHIFAYITDDDINKILRNSIYRYECRLKMAKIQSGSSNSVLYRCDKCQVIVDPQYLYTHAVNSGDKSCVKLRKHPCALCGLSFVSLACRVAHEKEHESIDINLKSFKIVLYNKEEHENYNNVMYDASYRYILYQCRNCEGLVDKFERNTHKCDDNNLKICSTCGLLLGKQDFDLHSLRHEELDKFNVENIIVVMFGKLKLCYLGKKKLKSTFSGTKYDYTMYKCKKCDLCFRTKESISEHVCVFDTSKCECSKCGLFFSKTDLKIHHKVHEMNLAMDELNMNLITFDASSAILHVDPKDKLGENSDLAKKAEEIEENLSYSPEKQDIIYKCDCGLHFLEELNAQQHANICNARMKISKQSCIKCDLLFTPGELFNHLLKHHYDKKLQFKFDVVLVSKKK